MFSYGPPLIVEQKQDTGCSPEDQPEAINEREEWRERGWDIQSGDMTKWWCLLFIDPFPLANAVNAIEKVTQQSMSGSYNTYILPSLT